MSGHSVAELLMKIFGGFTFACIITGVVCMGIGQLTDSPDGSRLCKFFMVIRFGMFLGFVLFMGTMMIAVVTMR